MSLPYEGGLVSRAKNLRKNGTRQEKHLWYDFLRNYPVRFQRQKPIERFVVDFYCHTAKLVVEVDGLQHITEQGTAYDRERSDCLRKYGLKIIRFSNQEVERNFSGVCEAIHQEVQQRIQNS